MKMVKIHTVFAQNTSGVTAKNAKLLQKIAADTVSTLLRK
jgi:hypothetical protein